MRVARFLDRIVFCLFAEDVGLLPENLFSRAVASPTASRRASPRLIGQLFDAMADGGDFGLDAIRHFNGDLFADGDVLELTADEIDSIQAATRLDWSEVDPSIFGTLFERGMDPGKRSQLGAHYTSREDIEARGRSGGDAAAAARMGGRAATGGRCADQDARSSARRRRREARNEAERLIGDFLTRLRECAGPRPGLRLRQFPLRRPAEAQGFGEGSRRSTPTPAAWAAFCRGSGRGSCTASRPMPTPSTWRRRRSGSAGLQWMRANGYRHRQRSDPASR